MNPHFSAEAPERPRPKGLYAQLDFIEPLGEGLALVGLDGVDAEWFAEFTKRYDLNDNAASADACGEFLGERGSTRILTRQFFIKRADRASSCALRLWSKEVYNPALRRRHRPSAALPLM